MSFKNLIGDILGYPTCPITGDTFWKNKKYVVSYTNTEAIAVSENAINNISSKEIAEVIYKIAENQYNPKNIYTLEQIIKEVEKKVLVN